MGLCKALAMFITRVQIQIDIANRLKKLPLSYFGKRDLADLAETMMNDMNLYETIFSHAVPHIYATAISTSIIAAMLFFYNWKLTLAALWVNSDCSFDSIFIEK